MQKSNLLLVLFITITSTLFAQSTFTLTSDDLGGQATSSAEFNGFGCTGDNQSPQLTWANAPAGTKSFAVTMYDPDAPTGSGWWHWVVYGGPCPPEGHGIHQYVITVHALKVDTLGLDANTNPAIVGYYLWNNTIAKASIVTYYQREK